MIALGDDGSGPVRNPIHRTRKPRADRHHPAPEREMITRFDDEMRMVPLQRVVHEPKIAALTPVPEGPLDLVHDWHRPQRRNAATHANGHVSGHQLAERRA